MERDMAGSVGTPDELALHSTPAGHPAVRTVVLCDDQQVLRDAIGLLLMNFPRYRVVGHAVDAAGCVQMLADLRPDIVIMDVSMPGGGRELVRHARAHGGANMHIVMFSGRHEPSVQAEMIAAGANVYVVKTGRLRPLIEALDAFVPHGAGASDSTPARLPAGKAAQPTAVRNPSVAGPPAPRPAPRPVAHDPRRHRAFFYANDREVIPELTASAATALVDAGHFIAIATPEHRAALRAGLPPAVVDRASAEGRFVDLDAAGALELFMRGGMPDADLFDRTVGASVLSHASRGAALLAWGEMVGLLWDQGNLLGTLRLEQLWNRLLQRVGFDLVCAYPSAAPEPPQRGFAKICDLHGQLRGVGERHQVS